MKLKRAIAYCRCSTHDQDIAGQEEQITRYVTHRGWELVKIYKDEGISGAKDSRPGLRQLLEDCRRGQVDVVVAQRLDRVGRNVQHLLSVLHEWQELGVAFVSLHEALDLTTAAGKLLCHLIAVFANYERDLIRERVKAGLEHARRRGKRLGRPPLKRLSSAQIAELREQRAQHQTPLRTLAKKYKVSLWTVHQLCRV